MNYLSVCSGVEAATVAWHHMGWNPIAFSEIEKFPSQVLAHRYPNVPNLGDMTKYKEWKLSEPIDILVGGTPCQSFSVAGLRKGLDDPRGNLALTYVGILDKFRPKWCVWENVPGVLSSGGGRDFGSFLGALGEIGYGWAYRVLDAQHFGVPQRRRRVFVIGCFGDWESAAKVLFESESLSGNTKKGRKERQDPTAFTASGFGNYGEGVGTIRAAGGDLGGGSETLYISDVANCLQTTCDDYSRADGFNMMVYENHPNDSRPIVQSIAFEPGIAKREGGNSRFSEEQTPTLRANMGDNQVSVAYSIREDATANNFSATSLEVTPAPQALRPSVQSHHAQTFIAGDYAVRRLTPVECERLQGFPDNYTNIRENCPDGPRYKAMGNSMAVPVMRWIGERINGLEHGNTR